MKPYERLHRLDLTLHRVSWIVPKAQRGVWLAEWIAELGYVYAQDPASATDLAQGVLDDAVTSRRLHLHSRWNTIDWEAPSLCVKCLVGCFTLLVVITMAQAQFRHLVFSKWGYGALACFVALALFSLPSTVVISRYGAYEAYSGDAATMEQR
ncbi:hypothetical protein BH10ACI4_BH10ACI4_38090 [soil metagenome]